MAPDGCTGAKVAGVGHVEISSTTNRKSGEERDWASLLVAMETRCKRVTLREKTAGSSPALPTINHMTMPKCEHCGLAHPTDCCNRPEGIAARGGVVLRMKFNPIGWKSCQPHQLEKGQRLGYLAAQRAMAGKHKRGGAKTP
jgi:hypothetical protein